MFASDVNIFVGTFKSPANVLFPQTVPSFPAKELYMLHGYIHCQSTDLNICFPLGKDVLKNTFKDTNCCWIPGKNITFLFSPWGLCWKVCVHEYRSDIWSAKVTNGFVVYNVSSHHPQHSLSAHSDSTGRSSQNWFSNVTPVVVHNRGSSNEDVRGMRLE